MERTPEDIRQTMGCAFAPIPSASLAPYVSIAAPDGCPIALTTCPGFTTRLPEVIESARARLHWSKGGPLSIGIRDWSGSALALGIELLEGTSNECQVWIAENPVKKAGA
jgi:hypothetical protein